ncbi:2-hydroxy-3-oxopropionate reductase [Vulcanimicrobium alpinum]|uniref:2-hydroxy-3-oxopropionate reductase n=1 Tax=Vulcanimicrobium alpinum TaxID=3016050 RepID=A0AAN1XX30_UNVUL|nr:NAD(P)-dependent oxidoreductase [Vulcanimicrobium alpinum]BDE06995.1 2-hydroxy-3-oxopropionate reductase [Vulcanimicrobium alpinum]
MATPLGMIGLGAMGEPMAASLLRAGFPVTACAHRDRRALERLMALGARDGGDPGGVGAASDVVVLCVPDAPQVEDALFGEHGATLRAKPGTLFIDMSTISPIASRAIGARLREGGFRFVDAPVSGGPARATSGTLTIMAGGTPEDYRDAEPVLLGMGTPRHVGPPGMGEVVKLVNQIIIANTVLGNIEALTFAAKAGADIDAVLEVIGTATGANYLLQNWLPKSWLAGSFAPGFALDLLRKDLAAALDSGRAMGVAMPSSALAYQMYTAASGEGHGRDDYTSVAQFYERAAGVQVRTKPA